MQIIDMNFTEQEIQFLLAIALLGADGLEKESKDQALMDQIRADLAKHADAKTIYNNAIAKLYNVMATPIPSDMEFPS